MNVRPIRTDDDLTRSRASEVLSGKRPLTLEMITAIGAAWRIPVAALIPEVVRRRAA